MNECWNRPIAAVALLAAAAWVLSAAAALPTGGICAHRGDRASCPENTVPAFLSAVSNGAAMVEFDVHRCKTGELIVMHDETIDRTTTGRGRWRDLSFEYLRSVDAGVKRGAKFAGTKIPTFDEAIDCFPKDGVWLNVHCGDDVTDEVARKIRAKGRLHQAFIAARAPGVARARAAVPEVKVCLFSLPRDSWDHAWTPEERRASIAAVMEAKAEFTQPHHAAFEPEELAAYHAAGGKVNYFWCNKPEKLAQLLARGIDFPLTDCLKPMVAAYRALRGAACVPSDPERGFRYLSDSGLVTGRLSPVGAGYRRADRRFGGIPSVAVSPKNGRLWRTYYAGPSDSEDSNNYVVLSTRRGKGDWEDVLYYDPDGDGPARSFDPEVWIAPDGRLHWTWTERKVSVRDGDANKWGAYRWQAGSECLRGVSLDAENPPAAPYPAPRTLVKAGGVMMCKPIVARDGSWLYPVAFWYDDFSARLYRSTDGGKTLLPVGGATLPERHREFDEHNVVELKDGTLRVYMRGRGNGAWNAWQADSHDGGRTWDAAKTCPFPHTNARFFVRRLASGALLLVKNGPATPPSNGSADIGRREMRAFVSDDDGATWKGGLLLREGPCAYPDGDQAPDGTIHVTFDGDRILKQEIFHVSFTEADIRGACGSRGLGEKIARDHKILGTDVFAGGARTRFTFEGCEAWVVEPPEGVAVAEGAPWTWTMQWASAFVSRTPVAQLLRKGWRHVTIVTFPHRMDETGIELSRKFQDYLVGELGFAPKACLIGMSWGGFFSTRYAKYCPGRVAAICYDCPLMNLDGLGSGKGDGPWTKRLPAEGWTTSPEMPINMAGAIAAQDIDILLLYGGADRVVPPERNCEIFVPRYRRLGGENIRILRRDFYAHHPHGVEESDATVANFFMQAFKRPRRSGAVRFSVFAGAVKRIMKERSVDRKTAVGMLADAGVTGFDAEYRNPDVPGLIADGMKPASLYGHVTFDTDDCGDAQGRAFVDTAVKYGAKRVMVIPENFEATADAKERERVSVKIVSGLRKMCAYGEQRNLLVMIEDFGNPNNICSDGRTIGRVLASEAKLCYAVDSGNFFYSGHGTDIVAFAKQWQDRIAHVHLKDQPQENPHAYRTLGEGAVPNAELLKFIASTGYAGWFTIENPVGDDRLADIIRQCAFVRRALGR